ncbi:hypothetical protein KR032_001786 [Drosophila birchii]|nr:hypothetical protein KR032_001786 [Drosophila birchii]
MKSGRRAEHKKDLLKQLIKCQKEIDKINEMTSNEMLTVEEKYEKLRKPLYEKRSEAIKRLPSFWGTSFIKHPELVGYMGEEGLRSIRSLEVEHLEKIKLGYRIHLHFDENPYFENKVLTKEFRFGNSKSGNWITSTSTPIQWKEGKNLLLAEQDSTTLYKNFFDWFSDNTNPNFDHIGDFIRDDLWINPLRYYCIETEPEENDIEEKQN